MIHHHAQPPPLVLAAQTSYECSDIGQQATGGREVRPSAARGSMSDVSDDPADEEALLAVAPDLAGALADQPDGEHTAAGDALTAAPGQEASLAPALASPQRQAIASVLRGGGDSNDEDEHPAVRVLLLDDDTHRESEAADDSDLAAAARSRASKEAAAAAGDASETAEHSPVAQPDAAVAAAAAFVVDSADATLSVREDEGSGQGPETVVSERQELTAGSPTRPLVDEAADAVDADSDLEARAALLAGTDPQDDEGQEPAADSVAIAGPEGSLVPAEAAAVAEAPAALSALVDAAVSTAVAAGSGRRSTPPAEALPQQQPPPPEPRPVAECPDAGHVLMLPAAVSPAVEAPVAESDPADLKEAGQGAQAEQHSADPRETVDGSAEADVEEARRPVTDCGCHSQGTDSYPLQLADHGAAGRHAQQADTESTGGIPTTLEQPSAEDGECAADSEPQTPGTPDAAPPPTPAAAVAAAAALLSPPPLAAHQLAPAAARLHAGPLLAHAASAPAPPLEFAGLHPLTQPVKSSRVVHPDVYFATTRAALVRSDRGLVITERGGEAGPVPARHAVSLARRLHALTLQGPRLPVQARVLAGARKSACV